MKKKIALYIFFCLFVGLSFSKRVFALDFKLDVIATPDNYAVTEAGGIVNFQIFLKPGESETRLINKCSFTITPDSGIELTTANPDANWSIETGTTYTLNRNGSAAANPLENETLLNVSFKVNSPGKVTISNIKCSTSDTTAEDTEGTSSDITKVLSINEVSVKIDGVSVDGTGTELSKDASNFTVSVTSNLQSSVKISAIGTGSGEKTLCSGEDAKNCVVDFSDVNFCGTDECKDYYSQVGNFIKLNIYTGSETKSFYITKPLENKVGTLSSLKVWGQIIELKDGVTEYSISVPSGHNDFSVSASISEPSIFKFSDDENPEKYNFETDVVILIVEPINKDTPGLSEVAYTININKEGGSNPLPSSSSAPPSSSSQIKNPQTGAISKFVVSLILIFSLIISLVMYKKNMESY